MITETDPTEAPITEAEALTILRDLPTSAPALEARLQDLPAHSRILLQQITGAARPRARHLVEPVLRWQATQQPAPEPTAEPAPAPSTKTAERKDPATLAAAAAAAIAREDTTMPGTLAAAAAASPLIQRLTRGRILAAAMLALREQIGPMLATAREALADGDLDVEEISLLAAQVGPAAASILTAAVPPLAALDREARDLMAGHIVGLLAVVADGLAERRPLGVWIAALQGPLRRPRLAELVGELLGSRQLRGAELAAWAYDQGDTISEILPDRDLLSDAHRAAALGHLAALVALAVSEGVGAR
jgi:hypothetical protein